ncbi:4-hydroxythreonine-4-phosphate dehydrogenase PdxA [Algoriphagus halophytocola]|uniref:4-hydroxythreonine-4-phosphate dehydrogenase PdxA n=1 Tax=Algoriphagus halophytocola TaxID=2991499 RepID=A0ABY6MJI7_9BACT|nr:MULTISPECIES: 4-hydroxythreonine-4-phosphate dehydrogenase PdxA [unclassified Algoriphagus]UZD23338.1 4-hydroxythreonine-4-phosphate dehydrogenase PdxA [Algoriphagus sp. TR-M5]WBL44633.1 4-hydroxythreonine-4-phosphate dehydrogenase PdxA [Algoriphagus sp. TR-M9]
MNHRKIKPIIGISIGDLNGIGVEVTMKALLDNRTYKTFTPLIYAHGKALTFYRKQLELEDFNFAQIRNLDEIQHKRINVINITEECPEIIPGVETQEAGKFALKSLETAVQDLKEGKIQALVTAPLNKNNVNTPELPFVGHTEYITNAVDAKDSLMLMVSEQLRVGLVTGHVPLSKVPENVTQERIVRKAKILLETLKKDFGITKPKVAILGLNPHAGEDGLLGEEEEQIIKPAIHSLKDQNKMVFGPYPADGFFGMAHQTKFDGVLAMYHDQGLVPFKSMAFSTGVNFTAGLPVIRTSPDHGTAYNIAGKNIADEGSMRAAIFLAADIIQQHNPQDSDD